MGHGEEKMPAETIEELREELSHAQLRLAFFERSQAAGHRTAAPMIHLKLIEVMREVTSVAKTGMNTQQNYPFRGIDGVMNEVGPAMRKVGVLAVPTVLQYRNRDTFTTGEKKTREVVVEVRYDFYAEDGSNVSAIVWGESLDFSDKGTAKALSVALRIALLQTLMLPTQEPTTDDNGHYHTRAGTPTLSGWTARIGADILRDGNALAVIDFWSAIVESSSIEAPVGPETTATWGELTARRLAEIIDQERSPEALRELYGKLKAADMLGLWHADESGRHQIGDLVIEQGKTARLNRDKAFNHCMELVTAAATLEELDAAQVHVRIDAEEGSITPEQLSEVIEVSRQRYDRLARDLNVAAETKHEFLPPTGEAWDDLRAALSDAQLTREDLDLILSGDDGSDITPPCEFGTDGVQRFIDAVKKAHSGYRTINAKDRAELFAGLRSRMHAAGIDWHEPID